MHYIFTVSNGVGLGLILVALGLMLFGNWRRKRGGGIWPLFAALPCAIVGVIFALNYVKF